MRVDPLHRLLREGRYTKGSTKAKAESGAWIDEILDQLEKCLSHRAPKGTMFDDVDVISLLHARFSLVQLKRVQRLTRRMIEQGGKGSVTAEEYLLQGIALTTDSHSIPFWLNLLDCRRKREPKKRIEQRRAYALAGLALLALFCKDAAAYDALQQAMYHDDPQVRGLAVHYLGRAYYDAEVRQSGEMLIYHHRDRYLFEDTHKFRPIPDQVLAQLSEIAGLDDAFAPRFQAREILRLAGKPIPFDNPSGTYTFKVKFMWNKRIFRTIEVRSDQTLEDLHLAIQEAIDWDDDHLYFFSLDGSEEDYRYRFASPWDGEKPFTSEAIMGEMGFIKKQKFLYYFDYGDSHRFEVEVVDIHPQGDHGHYPRLINSSGQAPAQYDHSDEDEWW